MGTTKENLAEAFAGESQANRKYLAFAKKAEDEGFKQVAKLFRAAAAAETVHAHNHLRIMGEIKSTSENLKTAIEGESHEFKKMYPEFLKVANSEGEKLAAWSFNIANQVEEIHAKLYIVASSSLKLGKDLEESNYYVCQVCGNTLHDVPDNCPICNAPAKQFLKIV